MLDPLSHVFPIEPIEADPSKARFDVRDRPLVLLPRLEGHVGT